MNEETVLVIEKPTGTSRDALVKVVVGAVAGYFTAKATDALYDKLIVEGRLKALLRRNK